MSDISEWDEVTIKTPGWLATPDQIADFLRAVFPEDAILAYQRRVTEAGLREAVGEIRETFENVKKVGGTPGDAATVNNFDPDHKEFGGFFPSSLVCPHHETGTTVAYGMTPAMAPCPGIPRCKGGAEIRATIRR